MGANPMVMRGRKAQTLNNNMMSNAERAPAGMLSGGRVHKSQKVKNNKEQKNTKQKDEAVRQRIKSIGSQYCNFQSQNQIPQYLAIRSVQHILDQIEEKKEEKNDTSQKFNNMMKEYQDNNRFAQFQSHLSLNKIKSNRGKGGQDPVMKNGLSPDWAKNLINDSAVKDNEGSFVDKYTRANMLDSNKMLPQDLSSRSQIVSTDKILNQARIVNDRINFHHEYNKMVGQDFVDQIQANPYSQNQNDYIKSPELQFKKRKSYFQHLLDVQGQKSKKALQFHLRDGNEYIQKEDIQICKNMVNVDKISKNMDYAAQNLPVLSVKGKTVTRNYLDGFQEQLSLPNFKAKSTTKLFAHKSEQRNLTELRNIKNRSLLNLVNTGVHQLGKSSENIKFQDLREQNMYNFKKVFNKRNQMAKERQRNDLSPYFQLDVSQRSKYSERRSCQQGFAQSTQGLQKIGTEFGGASSATNMGNLKAQNSLLAEIHPERIENIDDNEELINMGSPGRSTRDIRTEMSYRLSPRSKLTDITARKEAAKQRVIRQAALQAQIKRSSLLIKMTQKYQKKHKYHDYIDSFAQMTPFPVEKQTARTQDTTTNSKLGIYSINTTAQITQSRPESQNTNLTQGQNKNANGGEANELVDIKEQSKDCSIEERQAV